MSEPTAKRAFALVQRISPLLADQEPAVQGAALADLLATFLAGHVVVGSFEESEHLRDHYLALHVELVRKLIPENYKMRIEPQLKKRFQ